MKGEEVEGEEEKTRTEAPTRFAESISLILIFGSMATVEFSKEDRTVLVAVTTGASLALIKVMLNCFSKAKPFLSIL